MAYFPEIGEPRPTPIHDRAALRPGHEVPGPAIVEQADTTTVVYPGQRGRVDGHGNLILEVGR
jgi:N-methylhydantoinase A